jgi:hypothetical protein
MLRRHEWQISVILLQKFLIKARQCTPSPHKKRRERTLCINIKALRPDRLRPTQPLIQCAPGALALVVKWPGCDADHSPHLMPRSRIRGAIPPLPYTSAGEVYSLAQGHILPFINLVFLLSSLYLFVFLLSRLPSIQCSSISVGWIVWPGCIHSFIITFTHPTLPLLNDSYAPWTHAHFYCVSK